MADASEYLSEDAVIYSHTESIVTMCAACFRDETNQHHTHNAEDHKVVHGRIAAPSGMPPRQLLDEIDKALVHTKGARLFSPDLCLAARDSARAEIEQRRMQTLRGT